MDVSLDFICPRGICHFFLKAFEYLLREVFQTETLFPQTAEEPHEL